MSSNPSDFNGQNSRNEKPQPKSKVKVRVIEKGGGFPLPEMVKIPAGEFLMGTSDEQINDLYHKEEWAQEWIEEGSFYVEQPMHYVELPVYEIGKYPVTNQDYYKFIWEASYKLPRGWAGFRYPDGMDKHPVVGITKEDAQRYIEYVNQKSGRQYRLPTEAEWEKAARGIDGRIYPWGDDFDPWRCNTLESRIERTTPVDNYVPAGVSPFGVVGMSGNVWEWTSSRPLSYPFQPEPEPPDSAVPMGFVVRGGAWYYSQKLSRCAVREVYLTNYLSPALGFRLARSLED